jgi:UDP-N-acetylglucosamine--dolichyl-phosphate N-acetylglucosaminephosphotransferase
LGIAGAANAVNMLAGFNGLEAGMGIVAIGSLAIIAYLMGQTTSFIILIAALGALLATLYYNWYPAKILVGDVGTLTIGAIIASAVIIGNYEAAGVILMIPYMVDFLIKAKNHFPAKNWWGIYKDGKLYCPDSEPVGLCQLIMKVFVGISERNLVLALMCIEVVFGVIAILIYV